MNTLMTILAVIWIALTVTGLFVYVYRIDKPRRPITVGDAVSAIITNLAIIGVLIYFMVN